MPEERKLVTVLFADVTGSTALGEDLDPEDVRALMGRYYDHARKVVADHGGTLEKFIGDAVMAVFGLPHAHGDDAERAVAAALVLQKAVTEDPNLPDVKLRIGINTGEVVATSDHSSNDFLVTGDAVNVAARLQQAAEPGEVLVSERTHAASALAVLFGEMREMTVKGKREPLRVFPVLNLRATRRVTRPPMVGREDDLMMLSLLHRRAIREQRPQLVSLVAPAGTGKSRLLEAFLEGINPETGTRVAVSRCSPYGQTLAYWPLRGLLEDLVGGIDPERVIEAFLQGNHSAEDATRLADLVLSTLGIESEVPADRESIFNAWQLLVEALARSAPRVVVFEDLHWASDSLLDLVEHVMHPRTRAPLLLIAISRPELLDRRSTWGGGGRQNFSALVLDPLNETQTVELVEKLGPALPEAIRRRIVERSGGNPFFATELVRGLAERGIGTDVQAGDAVPDTVYAAVLARLDLLPLQERRVLQAAAVGGRSFRPAALHAVLDKLDSRDLDTAIEALVARDMIVPDEGGAFTFRHILIRDVAYGTLSRAERVRMHAAVAAWLEEFAAGRRDEFIGVIAYHYREAALLARRSAAALTLPFDPDHAAAVLERAGELAGRTGAVADARTYMQSAIEVASSPQHMSLYEKLGDVASFGDSAIEAYRQALTLWRAQEGEPLTGARLLRKILIIYMRWQGSIVARPSADELVAMRAEAKRLVEASDDEAERWRVRVADLFWPFWQGDITPEETIESTEIGLEAAAYFEERREWDFFHVTLDGYTSVLLEMGDHSRGIEQLRRRLDAPTTVPLERADTTNMLAWIYNVLGEFDEGIGLIQKTLQDLRPGEPRALFSHGISWALLSALLSGRWDTVDSLVPELYEGWDELQHDQGSGFLLGGFFSVLHVALARQDRPQADSGAAVLAQLVSPESRVAGRTLLSAYLADDPKQINTEHLRSPVHPELFMLILMFASERGVTLPLPLIEDMAKRAERLNNRSVLLGAQVARAVALRDPVALAEAIGAAEEVPLPPHAARMRIILAQMTADPAPLEQARPVLERLEDRQFLQRLEEVAASLC